MNTQAEAPTAVFDIVKQVFSAVFMVSGLAAFYYFSEVQLLYRVLGLLVIVLVVLGKLFGQVVMKQRELHCWFLQWYLLLG